MKNAAKEKENRVIEEKIASRNGNGLQQVYQMAKHCKGDRRDMYEIESLLKKKMKAFVKILLRMLS